MVRVLRCDDRERCLQDGEGGFVEIEFGRISANGSFQLSIDRVESGSAPLIFEAVVDEETRTTYRVINFGSLASDDGSGGGAALDNLTISPSSEAAVRILQDEGLATFTDQAILDVIEAVEQATADVSFVGVDLEDAIDRAEGEARRDPTVTMVLQEPRATPTPTPTSTFTATPTVTPHQDLVFVSRSKGIATPGAVTVISAATNSVVGDEIEVGIDPRGLAVDLDQERVFVANAGSDTISVIDIASRQVRPIADPDADAPSAIAFSNGRLYVVGFVSNTVCVFDVELALSDDPSGAHLATIDHVPDGPIGIAVARSEHFAYVTSREGSGAVSIIDTETNELLPLPPVMLPPVAMPDRPSRIALTRNDRFAYVTGELDASSDAGQRLYVINTAKARAMPGEAVVDEIPVEFQPIGLAFGPGDSLVYVANFGSNSLSVVSRESSETGEVVARVPLGTGHAPIDVGLTADGRLAYVISCDAGSVIVVDTGKAALGPGVDAVVTSVPVGDCPQGIAVVPP